MGVNMFGLADWTRTLPYVNLVRQGRQWGTADNPFNGNATFDPATGWPNCDFGMVLASLNLDLGGTYLFHAIGNASITNWESFVIQLVLVYEILVYFNQDIIYQEHQILLIYF